ncbi:Pex19 protein family-domain-containing protein [Lentinula aciculospora]|uniref:Pex19 protein family-domain-containing protein n=1 Tax=Lentinula aciculospora TaxID=153920 RepID=A0A9W8ZVV8_9AGAR|nr:Pex19 protein family-domain-containing protein [Lentinula aciculospora]
MASSGINRKANLQIEADEDLDDLDDVLSEFTTNPLSKTTSSTVAATSPLISPPPPPPTATFAKTRPRTNTRVDSAPISIPGSGALGIKSEGITERPEDTENDLEGPEDEAALSDAFTKELVKNMQDLMRGLAEEKKTESRDGEEEKEESEEGETERLMKAAWEAMLIEGMNGMTENVPVPSMSAAASTSASGTAAGSNFQSKIKQTMEKLKESEVNLQNSSSSTSAGNPETLQGLLNSLKDLGLDDLGANGGGEEDEAELASFLESMMGQLMSKDVLYEPLKELDDKFPPFLANPPTPVSSTDQTRYEKQYECVKRIIAIFDNPSYKEGGSEGAKVVDLMGELQSYGSPPESIMGSVPPELMGLGQDGPDGQCVVS